MGAVPRGAPRTPGERALSVAASTHSSAVQWLRTTAEGGLPCYPLFERDPFLDNIRNDPAFVAFLREQKAQWERFRATL